MKSTIVFIGLVLLPVIGVAQFNQVLVHELPFKEGENLTYTVKFGPVVGGKATLQLKKEFYKNMTVFRAVAQGKTVGFAEVLYSVNDVFESYFDQKTGFPYRIVRDVKEGSYRKHEEAFLDREKNTVYSIREDSLLVVPPEIMDMVSLVYFIRRINYNHLKAGDVIKSVTYFDDEIFPFDIRYKGKETVKTKFGAIRCHRFDPVVEPGRMFESEDDMQIWLSDDKNVIPVKVRFDLLVGSLRMELEEFANLKYPLIFSRN